MTPMLDIIFLNLIFFMAASTFDIDRSLKIDLPGSFIAESSISRDKIYIEIDDKQNLALNGISIKMADFYNALNENDIKEGTTAFIFGDSGADYKSIVDIIDILKLSGITNISLVTKNKEN